MIPLLSPHHPIHDSLPHPASSTECQLPDHDLRLPAFDPRITHPPLPHIQHGCPCRLQPAHGRHLRSRDLRPEPQQGPRVQGCCPRSAATGVEGQESETDDLHGEEQGDDGDAGGGDDGFLDGGSGGGGDVVGGVGEVGVGADVQNGVAGGVGGEGEGEGGLVVVAEVGQPAHEGSEEWGSGVVGLDGERALKGRVGGGPVDYQVTLVVVAEAGEGVAQLVTEG